MVVDWMPRAVRGQLTRSLATKPDAPVVEDESAAVGRMPASSRAS